MGHPCHPQRAREGADVREPRSPGRNRFVTLAARKRTPLTHKLSVDTGLAVAEDSCPDADKPENLTWKCSNHWCWVQHAVQYG